MSGRHEFRPAPGAIQQNISDDVDLQAHNHCRDVGDVHFCKASRITLGYEGNIADGALGDNGSGLLFMTREGGGVGLSIALTPKAMRSIAGSLNSLADKIDAKAMGEATAALDRAKAGGQ